MRMTIDGNLADIEMTPEEALDLISKLATTASWSIQRGFHITREAMTINVNNSKYDLPGVLAIKIRKNE